MTERIVIAGASMGGLRAAEQLRASGWSSDIVIIGKESYMPYNRPPLSKDLLRTMAAAPSPVATVDSHAAVAIRPRRTVDDVDWQLGVPATKADLDAGVIELADGRAVEYAGLVIATGLRPRRLPLSGPEHGRHVVRTLDDAAGLGWALRPGADVVVVGGGFIGCEVAATARSLGCEVVVVESANAPMGLALGDGLGRALQRHHERQGVGFRVGRSVVAIEGRVGDPERVGTATLDDGSRLAADVIIEAIGSHPNVEWLKGNALDLSNGVLCDNWMRVEGRGNVVAVGDVARFPNPHYDEVPRRVEHWCVPTDTAKRAGATLTRELAGEAADCSAFAPLPTFWSDQFGLRIRAIGAPALGAHTEVLEGGLGTRGDDLSGGVAIGYRDRSRLVGVVLIGVAQARAMHYRRALTGLEKAA